MSINWPARNPDLQTLDAQQSPPKPHCLALIHPQIMPQLGLKDHQTIKVCFATDSIELNYAPHGWGHKMPGTDALRSLSTGSECQ